MSTCPKEAKFLNKILIQMLVIWLMLICKNPFNLELRYSRNDLTTTTNSLSFAENIVCCLDEILKSETVDGALVCFFWYKLLMLGTGP